MKIGLFFGSFNPVHNGHLIIANYVCETTDIKKVWLVVSPHNPLKQKDSLLNEHDRIHLINLAIENNPNLKASNIEFSLPKPSYTIDTLTYLAEKYPQYKFVLLMGTDNLMSLHKWKNYELILRDYEILAYNRKGFDTHPFPQHPNVRILDFPFLDISATFIRNCIKNKISMQYFLPDATWNYIDSNNLYRK